MEETQNQLPIYEAKPTPDPTVLTTQQLLRESKSAREYNEARFLATRDLIEVFLSIGGVPSASNRSRWQTKPKGSSAWTSTSSAPASAGVTLGHRISV